MIGQALRERIPEAGGFSRHNLEKARSHGVAEGFRFEEGLQKRMTDITESETSAFRRENLGFGFQEFNLLDTFP